jgi:hypothetical protein
MNDNQKLEIFKEVLTVRTNAKKIMDCGNENYI